MKEMIIGLLGGGAAVQLINGLATLRQSRRQMNATALGGEVEALEKTIMVLFSNIERQNEVHRQEVAELREEIATLRDCKSRLQAEVERLAAMVAAMRERGGAVPRQMAIDFTA